MYDVNVALSSVLIEYKMGAIDIAQAIKEIKQIMETQKETKNYQKQM